MLLNCERLDDRINPATFSYNSTTGVFTIEGSNNKEWVNVALVNWQVGLRYYDYSTGEYLEFALPSGVKKIVAHLNGGDDAYYNNLWIDNEVHGGNGNDHISGGDEAAAWLYGDAGNDTLIASNTDYTQKPSHLFGGTGADRIQCSFGPDTIYGFNANEGDTIMGFNPATDVFI